VQHPAPDAALEADIVILGKRVVAKHIPPRGLWSDFSTCVAAVFLKACCRAAVKRFVRTFDGIQQAAIRRMSSARQARRRDCILFICVEVAESSLSGAALVSLHFPMPNGRASNEPSLFSIFRRV